MIDIGYYNGEFGPIDEMKVPMLDRGVYFGDGVYEAVAVRNRVPFALGDHLDRFLNSCRLLEIPSPLPRERLARVLQDMIDRIDGDDAVLYWQATRGTARREHAFPEGSPSNLMIMVRPAAMQDIRRKVKLITTPDTRYELCNIKTLNLIPNVLASQRAKEAGCHEAVFHRGNIVTECSHSNLLILQGGALRTHPLNNRILPGITRMHLIRLARENGVPVREEAFTLNEMSAADEILVTSTTALCLRACEIDGRPVGGAAPEILFKLQDAYLERFLRETNGRPL